MISDLLPVLSVTAALLVLPMLGMWAIRGRKAYCGHQPNQCFWCNRHCEHYALKEVP